MDNAIEILEKRNKLFFPQIHNVQKKFRRSSCVYRQSETFENTRLRNNIIGQGTTETWTIALLNVYCRHVVVVDPLKNVKFPGEEGLVSHQRRLPHKYVPGKRGGNIRPFRNNIIRAH